ncbi:MAG TPA: hypothetical protein VEH86_02505 [Candidatus Acidoferrum sp.]|nr:hypothetical protein [Candidatus Acidoferrum sp.]
MPSTARVASARSMDLEYIFVEQLPERGLFEEFDLGLWSRNIIVEP